MTIRPRRMAEEDFAPFFADFYTAMVEGHADYARQYARQAGLHRRNTRRDIIRDHAVDRLRKALEGRRGVHIRERYGTTHFHFSGRWLLIVHKIDDEHHIVPNRTELSLSLHENDTGMLFAGATTVFLGYLERGDGVQVLIVCPNGQHWPYWYLPIERPSSGEIIPLLPREPPPLDEELLVVVPAEQTDRESDE